MVEIPVLISDLFIARPSYVFVY